MREPGRGGRCKLISSCPALCRASTSLQRIGIERRGWPGRLARRRASRFCPAMTRKCHAFPPRHPPPLRHPLALRRERQRPRMHVLEAGYETKGRPCVLLLHGFPELAYSWRKVMPALAAAGYHVIAPDQRGYGRTTGWDADYDGDLAVVPLAEPGARRDRRWCRRSAIAPSRPWSATISAPRSRPGARWCGPTSSRSWC